MVKTYIWTCRIFLLLTCYAPGRKLPSSVNLCVNNALLSETDKTRSAAAAMYHPLRSIDDFYLKFRLRGCAWRMSDIRLMIPFLARLGATIEEKLPQPVPTVLQEQEQYGIKIVSSVITRREISGIAPPPHDIFAHQQYKWLQTTPSADAIQKLPDIMCEALEELSEQRLSPLRSPNIHRFSGYKTGQHLGQGECFYRP